MIKKFEESENDSKEFREGLEIDEEETKEIDNQDLEVKKRERDESSNFSE